MNGFEMYFVIIIIFLFLLSIIVPKIMQKYFTERLTKALFKKDFEDFDRLIENKYIKWAIDPFNIDFMKLNRAMAAGDKKTVNDCFEHFEKCNLTAKQLEAVYYHGFYYYVSIKDKDKSRQYGRKYSHLDNILPETKQEMKEYYQIFMENSYLYLDKYLQNFKEAANEDKAKLSFMIAKMYDNMGDKDKAKEYMDNL